MILSLILVILVVIGDQVSKYYIVQYFGGVQGSTLPIIEDIFHFTYVENRGAAFGMLSEHRWVFMILSTVGIAAIAAWLIIEKPKSRWMCSSVAFVIGGGIGNMIDRVRLEYVVDFIDCRFIDFYVFNVADSFVCIGCGMFILYTVYDELIQARKKKDAAASEAAEASVSQSTTDTDGNMKNGEDNG